MKKCDNLGLDNIKEIFHNSGISGNVFKNLC